jgi:hypothetical protein
VNDNADFAALHRAMKAAVETQDRVGWASPEIENLSKRVLMGLWVGANNPSPLPKAVVDALAADVAALTKAREPQ